ncbi:hypothetical protein SAMN03080598_03406 [Algoriphagus boritolerans DSM 17298 = JCM 18970]|uniref:Uncharacterized protein n=1 Tax=Algoriphagus boritolerans DSM 17298 = JCM 18970 TaxID=1120964 RepID=A0A1H5ZA96_9BACT|nr:hypothetical protein SAMN03080598_03406 [Algoriphagus boritolerans DSM 17298 = JCM 18970]
MDVLVRYLGIMQSLKLFIMETYIYLIVVGIIFLVIIALCVIILKNGFGITKGLFSKRKKESDI